MFDVLILIHVDAHNTSFWVHVCLYITFLLGALRAWMWTNRSHLTGHFVSLIGHCLHCWIHRPKFFRVGLECWVDRLGWFDRRSLFELLEIVVLLSLRTICKRKFRRKWSLRIGLITKLGILFILKCAKIWLMSAHLSFRLTIMSQLLHC